MSKHTDELCAYADARAEALAKLSFPSSSSSLTKSTSVTTTDGKKEDKTSETKEEKESSGTVGPVEESRLTVVAIVDTKFYSKALSIFHSCFISLIAAMDFMEKNKTKLLEPKGSQGSRSGFSSMY